MLNNLSIAQPYEDRIYISNSGILALTEDLYREPFSKERNRSRLKATFTDMQYSGLIDRLYYEVYDGNLYADNVLEFFAVPSDQETVTIGDVTYTFVSTLTAVNQVPLPSTFGAGDTPLFTAMNLYNVVNRYGTAGTNFFSGQIPNLSVSGILSDNPLYFRALASGIIGNTYGIQTDIDPSTLYAHNKYFTKGGILLLDPIAQGYVTGSGNGSYILTELPTSEYGLNYYTHLYFTNYSGLQALNVEHNPVDYWGYTNWFTGRTHLHHYAEVSGIMGEDLYDGKIPSSGKLQLSWNDMNTYSEISAQLAWPITAGTPTRTTETYHSDDLGQNLEYVIFVFKSTSGSAPQCSWPRFYDTNGTWYFVGKTSNTYATIVVPIGTTYSVWVGFGNKETLLTAGSSLFYNFDPTIYMES